MMELFCNKPYYVSVQIACYKQEFFHTGQFPTVYFLFLLPHPDKINVVQYIVEGGTPT